MVQANTGIYGMLRPQKSAFDYFLQGQNARQQHDSNTQLMQAREQSMQQAAAMDPLLLQQAQQGLRVGAADEAHKESMRPLQISQAEVTKDTGEFNLNQAVEKKGRSDELRSYGQLAVMADNLKNSTVQDSPERQEMLATMRPQIEEAIKAGKLQIDPTILDDGLSDEEIDGFITSYKAIKPAPKPMSAKEAAEIAVKEREAGVKESGLDIERDELAEEKRQFNATQKFIKTDAQKIEHEVNMQTAKSVAKKQAEKITAAPAAIRKGESAINLIDDIFSHKGKGSVVGSLATPSKYIPGTDAHDFTKLIDRLEGQAFMQAYMELKGGGSITEVETKQAVKSLIQAATSQSPEAFDKALLEFRNEISEGVNISQSALEQEPKNYGLPQNYQAPERPGQGRQRGRPGRPRQQEEQPATTGNQAFDNAMNKYGVQ